MSPVWGAGETFTATTQAAARPTIMTQACRGGWKALTYMARNIGAIRHMYSAVNVTWKAITIGVAAHAASVAGIRRYGATARCTSADTPRPMAMIPPIGLP